ncbi:gliding motility-associated C-terminal domain-containing protein [Algoriphagus zhangzhouensis]|uniref:C-terminal domain of CHU protein family protein n=1 Tax=Algoriphagus zhangzhouensis TaxID=1073327 RepID=A0A1M7ZEM4_9BACT|nr:gliding motility-associated C-terminal domain-containing protein [Algoriphagus zhangzhouensis]TDY46093.1 CHU domain-containing protein [Algoriphagus zhangzhouensis]SHO63355.1 C-terminal domain of CHU protein family protein [Algoriphagus zhangzhouensis]
MKIVPKKIFFSLFLAVVFILILQRIFPYPTINTKKAQIEAISLQITQDEPNLTGPEILCYAIGGQSIIGTFSGGGNPEIDTYTWNIYGPDNSLIFTKPNAGGLFETISYTFNLRGTHRVELTVTRGLLSFPTQTLEVLVQDRPTPSLNLNYTLCENDSISLQAIDSQSPNFDIYNFAWKNANGDTLGTENLLSISQIGEYYVDIYTINSQGSIECSTSLYTQVSSSSDITVSASTDAICTNQSISLQSEPETLGNWYLKKAGESTENLIGTGSEINIHSNTLTSGYGDYEVIFEVITEDSSGCQILVSAPFTYNQIPDFKILDPIGASDCNANDGGVTIEAITPIDYIYVEETTFQTPPLAPGDQYTIPGLVSGAYQLIAVLGNCGNSYGAIVPIIDLPPDLEFTITDQIGETCTTDGKLDGSFKVNLTNGPMDGYYKILGEKGELIQQESFTGQSTIDVQIRGGSFIFELNNLDSCSFPAKQPIEIPSKGLVNYSIPKSLAICQTFDLYPQTNQALEFELIDPNNNSQTILAGDFFTITEDGEYKMIGRLPEQSDFCPVSKIFNVTLVDPVEFEVVQTEEDCLGNKTYKAEIYDRDSTAVIFTWYNNDGDIVGTNQYLNPIGTGTFKLDVQPANSSSCPNPPLEFEITDPVLSVDATLTSTKLCEFGPEAIVNLETTFPEAVTDVRWRRFDEDGEIIELSEYDDLWEITTRIGGTYEASVYSIIPAINKNCELGRSSIQLNLVPDKVLFDIPSEISVCQSFALIPETEDGLNFFVTSPSGEILEGVSGDSFILDQEGTYTFLAFDQDSPTPFCPEQKEIVVTLVEPVIFNPVLSEAFCDGSRIYQAELENYSPDDVLFTWRDSNGGIIGEEEFLTLPGAGTYSLEVQPKNSEACPYLPKEFTEDPPIFEVEVSLDPEPLCPDADSAIITLNTDLDQVTSIEWWFTDLNGNQTQLTNFNDQTEILAIEEGTYEARAFNFIPCLVGTDQVIILRSQDDVRPIVEESYQICPRYEIGPNIDPGDFASYEWYFEGQLVSENPIFKPQQVGNYQLVVYSLEGCAYEATFSTLEECELKVVFPTALTPNNPDKPFLIYTNYLVDELELWIFNQWGELIFHCKNTDLINEESTCVWDGTFNGEKVPNGAYSFRVNYRNIEKNIQEEYLGSLLVVE